MKSEFQTIQDDLRKRASQEKATHLLRFFKTGSGQYGEGDLFLGIVVPDIRTVVKLHRDASIDTMRELLHSPYHEDRMTGLLLMVHRFTHEEEIGKKRIYDLYLSNTRYINNWDLVDLTAPHIVGGYLYGKNLSILVDLAHAKSLWERRIAILATFYFIYKGETKPTIDIATILLHDEHDLIHKAVGWMLREVGKRCSENVLRNFLDRYGTTMPRTMLRYAIERLPKQERLTYLHAK
jgi:3-methyladenine DNA glycosylase AlkD